MKRKQTISIASDTRGRVPFALISVVLLSTSVVAVSILNQRPTPERDISPELVNERTTTAVETLLSDAVSDAIKEAGREPVTQASGTEIGAALSGGGADSSEIFERYVRLRIYLKVSQRLEQTTQRRSSPRGDVSGQAFLPELSTDQSEVEAAIDKVDLTTAAESDDLQKGEYEVTIDGIQQTVTAGDREIHREENSYTVTDETAVFEMHRQTSAYQEKLDTKLEPLLYSRQYPLFVGKALFENFMGQPFEAYAYPEIIGPQELEVFTNEINYKLQESTFGTTDQSYPTMMDAGYICLGHRLGGQFLTGISGKITEYAPTPLSKRVSGAASFINYPSELACYFTMYSAMEQATTTATTDMPETSAFGRETTKWKPRESQYNHTENAGEVVNEFEGINHRDPGSADGLSAGDFESGLPTSENQIQIGPIANETYIQLFNKDPDLFGEEVDEDVGESLPDGQNVVTSDDLGDPNTDINNEDIESQHEANVNNLRKQIIEDVDPIEANNIQMISADNIYGGFVQQIEQNEQEYVYDEQSGSFIYGIRNAYIKNLIYNLEKLEEERKKARSRLERESGMDIEEITESLVRGQAAIEGEADNPERIAEIGDQAGYTSPSEETDRFDEADRTAYVYDPDDGTSSRESGVEIDSSGVPETVTEQMLWNFDGLPETNEVVIPTSITLAGDDRKFAPSEIDEENRTDDAYTWNIRPVELDRHIYKITNEQLTDRTLPGRPGIIVGEYEGTYTQLHKINADMNLTDGAEDYLGENAFIITALDAGPEKETTTNPIDNPEELVAPEIQPPAEQDFEFTIHASPGYLSGLPISREAEPTIRPAGKGVNHNRNTLHTPYSSKILNPLPNPGLPIIPWPKFWFASANYWKTDVKGEYARFELQSESVEELNSGPESYVRQDQTVELTVGGSPETVGSVEPIGFDITNHFVMVAPGMIPSKAAPPQQRGSWGTGNSIMFGAKDQETGEGRGLGVGLFPAWRPEHCTPGWPEVGPGVDPEQLDRGCADYGPIGEILAMQGRQTEMSALMSRIAQSAVLLHVALAEQDPNVQMDEQNITADERNEADALCYPGNEIGCRELKPRG